MSRAAQGVGIFYRGGDVAAKARMGNEIQRMSIESIGGAGKRTINGRSYGASHRAAHVRRMVP